MKIPNYLMSSLAIVGAFSLIIMACSADNSNTNTASATATTSTVGRYQISSHSTVSSTGNIGKYFDVIDTETGIVKSYAGDPNTHTPYTLMQTTVTQ